MGLASEIQSATATAHRNLAKLQGLQDDAEGNVIFSGRSAPVVGVFSRATVQWIPQPGGGYRKKTSQVLSVARSEMETPAGPNTKLARVDLTPAAHYVIESVNTGNPLAWEFTVNRFDA